MAKLKTFASGAPLTAADVNAYLVPDVPPGATTYDEEVSIPLAAGYSGSATARRIGCSVHVRWVCTSSFASLAAALPLFTLPEGFRPEGDVSADVGGQALYPWTARITSVGLVQVRNNHTAAQTSMIGSATFTVPKS